LKKNNWKRGPTADSLGMDRRTLFRKMKDFGLEKE
jgi:transcriptional regulator of acetoin/glycerol metabolism